MVDYWSKLPFSKRGKKDRFNFLLNHIDEVSSSSNPDDSGNQNQETPKTEDPEVTTSNISVTVLDREDKPINGATVTVSKDSKEYTGNTGTAGGCTIRNVPLGDYVIETVKEGYVTSEDDFTVVAGENIFVVNLDLENVGPEGESPHMVDEEDGD